MKFQPATVSMSELHQVAARERPLLAQQFKLDGEGQHLEEVWTKTLEEVQTGSLVGPLDLAEFPSSYPLSRRFGCLRSDS